MTTSANNKFWTGASVGIAVATVLVCAVTGFFVLTGIPRWLEALTFAVAGTVMFFALVVVAWSLSRLFRRIPPHVFYFSAAALGTLYLLRASRFRFRWDATLFYAAALVLLFAGAVFFGAYWARHDRRRSYGGVAGLAFFALVAGVVWITSPGRDPFPVEIPKSVPSVSIDAENPAAPGSFDVLSLTYGSGTDRRRPEFGADVDVTAPTVDASDILPEWRGFRARARRWYWGITIEETPLNGRVWMPAGEGPFPLVLVVHGNHSMEDVSDPGYAYLGVLLASRGMITVSVDENFINGTWSGDFRGREMPMRAWLLLEHLRVWHEWNETPGHRFFEKVDTERIGLMGHSRGGEAVSVAYAFNELDHFPNDATVAFDYGFSIQALVAIAQTDRHYPRRVKLDNVNFLTLQGSYDSDEASSFGMRQFRRIRLAPRPYRFKAGVYIHGANHGQFNTTWGMDSGPPGSWLLNKKALISAEDQVEIAKVYISAFLEATLHQDRSYMPLFQDARAGAAWLPSDIVTLNQFEDSTFRAVADFEEDLDVTTATFDGAVIDTEGLTLWREEELRFRDNLTQGTNGVVIGSDGDQAGALAIRFGAYRPDASPDSALTFFLSSSPENTKDGSSLELTVELVDGSGAEGTVRLNDVMPITPPLKVQFLKVDWLNRKRFPRDWEATFQSYSIPLEAFGEIDPGNIAAIRFVTEGSGVVILDDIGFRSTF